MRKEEDPQLLREDQEHQDLKEDLELQDHQVHSQIWDLSWGKWSNKLEKKDLHLIHFHTCKLRLAQLDLEDHLE